MPMRTNGVYQDKSVPGKKNVGVGTGVSNSGRKDPGMGGNQYSPSSPGYSKQTKSSMDDKGNSSYSR